MIARWLEHTLDETFVENVREYIDERVETSIEAYVEKDKVPEEPARKSRLAAGR